MNFINRNLFFAIARIKGYCLQQFDNEKSENGKYIFVSHKRRLVGALEINLISDTDDLQDILNEDRLLHIDYIYLNNDPSIDAVLILKGLLVQARIYAKSESVNLVMGSSYDSFKNKISPIIDMVSLENNLDIKQCADCTSVTLKEKFNFLSYSDSPFFMNISEGLKAFNFSAAIN